jgi:outer membrane protein TolC
LFLLALAWAAGAGASDSSALTRRAAVAEALAKNPQLAVSRAQIEEARAGIAQATAFPDPAFSWAYEQQRSIWNFNSAQARDIGATFTIPFPDKFRLNRRVSEAVMHAAEFSYRQLQEQIASQAAEAYDALLVAQAQLENDRQSQDLSKSILEKTQARYDAGTVARLDVLQAKVNLAQATNQTISDDRAVMTAAASLNRVMGRAAGPLPELAQDLSLPPVWPSLSDLTRLASENRPEIASIRVQRDGARFAAELAREFWFPDLSLTLYRNFTEGSPSAYSTAGNIAIPLFFWQHEKGDVAAAEYKQVELAADESDTVAQVDLDVRNAYATADAARRQAVYIRDDLLPEARDAYDVASKSYALGGSSALDLINAKSALLAATSQLTQALGAVNDAVAALEKAIGSPLPDASTEGAPHEP